MAYVTHMIKH